MMLVGPVAPLPPPQCLRPRATNHWCVVTAVQVGHEAVTGKRRGALEKWRCGYQVDYQDAWELVESRRSEVTSVVRVAAVVV